MALERHSLAFELTDGVISAIVRMANNTGLTLGEVVERLVAENVTGENHLTGQALEDALEALEK